MLKKNIKGVTLLEAFLAAFLFVTSVAAIFVSMNALRKPATNNERKVTAAILLKTYLEDLRSKVDNREYSDTSGVFQTGTHPPLPLPLTPPNTVSIAGVLYTISYSVNAEFEGSKQVNATITWVDPT